jgi:hypothetical protein
MKLEDVRGRKTGHVLETVSQLWEIVTQAWNSDRIDSITKDISHKQHLFL